MPAVEQEIVFGETKKIPINKRLFSKISKSFRELIVDFRDPDDQNLLREISELFKDLATDCKGDKRIKKCELAIDKLGQLVRYGKLNPHPDESNAYRNAYYHALEKVDESIVNEYRTRMRKEIPLDVEIEEFEVGQIFRKVIDEMKSDGLIPEEPYGKFSVVYKLEHYNLLVRKNNELTYKSVLMLLL